MDAPFAEKIAKHLYMLKWKNGYKQNHLVAWLAERFPNLTPEDAAQIKAALPANFNGTR